MFIFEPDKIYSMPPFFGGAKYNKDAEGIVKDALIINITEVTDAKLLNNYLPRGFKLLRPELTIGFAQFRQIDFLAGSSYNAVQVTVPVSFNGKRDNLEGNFNLVVWENKTVPITGGREETGIPKIYADIQDFHILNNKYFSNLSFEGNTFLRISMTVKKPMDTMRLDELRGKHSVINTLGWRYIPKIGGPGADLSQPVLYPQYADIDKSWVGEGSAKWTKLTWEQNERQAHIISSLASLPVFEVKPAVMMHGTYTMKPITGRVLE